MKVDEGKFTQAKGVLKVVKKHLTNIKNKDLHISLSAYSNGREQGFHLGVYGGIGKSLGFSFSENRNSDDIVIYCGTEYNDFAMQGNVPGDKAYKNVKYFDYKDYSGAAEYIVNKIKEVAK